MTIVFSIIFAMIFFWQKKKNPLLSPIADSITTPFQSTNPTSVQSEKIVYGFLPFWQAKTFELQPELTNIAYFSLTLNANGTVKTKDGLSTDPGYRLYNSQTYSDLLASNTASGVTSELTISLMNNQDIRELLLSESAQKNTLNTIQNILLDSPLKGINIDIEYSGESPTSLQQSYSQLIVSIDAMLEEQFPEVLLSIDIYPSGIEKKNIWDVAQLEPYVDYFIIMAYDFHRSSSSQSGPIAPLLSAESDTEEKNISRYVGQFTKEVPKEKILLGIPFYGYEWQVVSNDARSKTYPKSGSTASYQRIQNILSEPQKFNTIEHLWEYSTLSPYIIFEEQGNQKIIFYENEQSLQYKLDFVKQSELAGIAIWALGYEGGSRNLWSVIQNNFSKVK